jgi:hypothetical protein
LKYILKLFLNFLFLYFYYQNNVQILKFNTTYDN